MLLLDRHESLKERRQSCKVSLCKLYKRGRDYLQDGGVTNIISRNELLYGIEKIVNRSSSPSAYGGRETPICCSVERQQVYC